MRCCVKLGSLELQAENCLGTLHNFKAGGISTCTEKPAEMNLFKYAKVMSCIMTATSILGMFRYLQYQLHKLMLCTLGVSKIMDSANHNISFKAVSQFFGIAYPSSFFLANGLPSDTRYDRDVT